jgi:cell wall-associated protease
MQKFLKSIPLWAILLWSTVSLGGIVQRAPSDPDSIFPPKNWINLDPQDDGVMGTSSDKAYEELLKGKTPKKRVVVAVIDSGVDIEHEDLQGKIWTNTNEIPGNGIDDDRNGYVDDVHGWNFIGGADGANIDADSYELTREYNRLQPKYENADPDKIKRRDRDEYAHWLAIKEDFESKKEEAEMNFQFTSQLQENLGELSEVLKEAVGKEDVTPGDLKKIDSDDPRVAQAGAMVAQLFANVGADAPTLNAILEELSRAVDHYKNQVDFAFNPDFDPRDLVGDEEDNYKERRYGNNDVTGPDASHGTHVAGIIAADRNNTLGMRGIADHVLIMSVRAVPNGDERDKDVANSIYYAVDNGADIINMSFGKSYSPGKKYVDKAVKYAQRKGVLLIHAAGNSGEEVTPTNNYPNRWLGKRGKAAGNWIAVGASSWEQGESLPGSFSNYSSQSVDFFAPGVDVYSTLPGNDYDENSGTSMAAPAAAGVAALLLAYYPELKPSQVVEILQESVYGLGEIVVSKPGEEEQVPFGSLSITGGVVNAYKAIQLAEQRQ